MNTVSIAIAPPAALPPPAKSTSGPARPPQAPGESAFQSQLQDAVQERKGRSGPKDPKQRDPEKQDVSNPPIAVAVVQAPPPPPPAAGFGLPAPGVEPGSNTAPESIKTSAVVEQAPAVTLPPDTPPKPVVNPPTPPPKTVQPDRKTELAFALRLGESTPHPEIQAEAAPRPAPLTGLGPPKPPDPKVILTPSLPPAETQPSPVVAASQPVLSAPVTPPQNGDSALALPIKTAQPPPQPQVAAIPVAPIVPARQEAAPQSGSHSSDGGAPGKDTSRRLQPQPAADTKSFRPAAPTSDPVITVSREAPPPMRNPTPVAAPPAPAAPPPPEPAAPMTASIPVERVSVPLAAPHPPSPVTDVSLNMRVPRADASGDDRVAIRMLQRGSEIHVSVRTPDTQLAQSLRQDLGKLTTGLDQGGFHTETWRPAAANAAAQTNTDPRHQPAPDTPQRDGLGGNRRQDPGEQKRKQQDDRPRWVAELEQQKNQ